ncbi:MAG: hypothetical protein U0637_14015 [Phycisphaerales bacterium]
MRILPARHVSAALLIALAAGSAMAEVGASGVTSRLASMYPGVSSYEWGGRVVSFGGVPMTEGATARDAAENFLLAHSGEFGAGALELLLRRSDELDFGRKTVFVYDQSMGGVPVEFGAVWVTVLNTEVNGVMTHRVASASAKLARRGDDFPADVVAGAEALKAVRGSGEYGDLSAWTEPSLVVFFGEGDLPGWTEATRAWKFTGGNGDAAFPRKFTFFVDAASGRLLAARNEIHNVNITGIVQGLATPGSTADYSGNPPVLTPMPEMQVHVVGSGNPGTNAYTDTAGNFTIPWAGTAPVSLEVRLRRNGADGNGGGLRTDVIQSPDAVTPAAEIAVTQSVTPGTPATINVNPASSEYTNAQVNAYLQQTRTRNYFMQWAPTFTGLANPLPAYVMINASCNAYYDGVSTNFYNLAGSCNNTAFSSVVAHEYGHHIVNQLGLAQGSFGEGFGDTVSMLQYDDAVEGRYFFTNGGAVRTPDTANVPYPCSGEIHYCGQVVGGMTWEIRKNLGTRYGNPTGLNTARQLHAEWALSTVGGLGNDSAHPQTTREYLTVDDVDANWYNGTPNLPQLVAAFAAHSIPYPELRAAMTLVAPGSFPALHPSGTPIPVDVVITSGVNPTTNVLTTLTPGTARVEYSTSGASGPFTSVALTAGANNHYTGAVPGAACLSTVYWRVAVDTSAGTARLPGPDSGAVVYTQRIGDGTVAVLTDTFEGGAGAWTTSNVPDGNGTLTGDWVWGDPLATSAQPASGSVGVNCWFTGQGVSGGGDGAADVDNGQVVLTSPAFNLSGRDNVEFAYDRWYSNGLGAAPGADTFRVQASSDNGATWVTAETVGPTGAGVDTGWTAGGFSVAGVGLAATGAFRVRFIAEDAAPGSLIEAAVDNLRIRSITCAAAGCDTIDFNHDSLFPDTTDIDDFLRVFSGGACSTGACGDIDFNNDGLFPDTSDIDALLRVFSGGAC